MELKTCFLAKVEDFSYSLIEQHAKQLSHKFQKFAIRIFGGGLSRSSTTPPPALPPMVNHSKSTKLLSFTCILDGYLSWFIADFFVEQKETTIVDCLPLPITQHSCMYMLYQVDSTVRKANLVTLFGYSSS